MEYQLYDIETDGRRTNAFTLNACQASAYSVAQERANRNGKRGVMLKWLVSRSRHGLSYATRDFFPDRQDSTI